MRLRNHIQVAVVVGLSLAVLVACDQDPLGLSKREIAAGYVLERAEMNYFLIDAQHQDDVGGVIEGVVLSIGWNDRQILVERHSIFSGDPDGFMAIDLKAHTLEGPFTRAQVDASSELSGIELRDPAKAWESLLRQ